MSSVGTVRRIACGCMWRSAHRLSPHDHLNTALFLRRTACAGWAASVHVGSGVVVPLDWRECMAVSTARVRGTCDDANVCQVPTVQHASPWPLEASNKVFPQSYEHS